MRNCVRLAAIFLLSGAALVAAAQVMPSGPFAGVDLAVLPADQRQVVIEASEDFQAVLAGKLPPHATHDLFKAAPADGGTAFYSGRKYKLTIEKSLSSFGSLSGYVYGPIIVFDESFAPGNENRVSSLRFYTQAQLVILLVK